ncbi:MAG: Maf family protein [Alphaproteobacteria bacterium]|jgi:septum formation protein
MTSPKGGSPIDSNSDARLALVLASESPRRRDLLAKAGIIPDLIVPARIDETVSKGEIPRAYVKRMALAKADAVASQWQGGAALILAADTVVACGRRILPKATTDDAVRYCLEILSGRSHQVLTAVAIHNPDGSVISRTGSTRVVFARLSHENVGMYVASGEGLGKAGGYAVQGQAEKFIRRINGSYSNIVGLPLFYTLQLLQGCGYLVAKQSVGAA